MLKNQRNRSIGQQQGTRGSRGPACKLFVGFTNSIYIRAPGRRPRRLPWKSKTRGRAPDTQCQPTIPPSTRPAKPRLVPAQPQPSPSSHRLKICSGFSFAKRFQNSRASLGLPSKLFGAWGTILPFQSPRNRNVRVTGGKPVESKTRTYHGRVGAGRGGGGLDGTPTGRFAQETTDPFAHQGMEDNCPGRCFISTDKRNPM